jgi:hypothetical protein
VTVSFVEPKETVAPVAKFCPIRRIDSGPVLTIALEGLAAVTLGGTGLTVKVSAFETNDRGLGSTTVTGSAPVDVRLAAGTVATSCVAEVKTVVSDTPFNWTRDDEMKFCPVTVKAKLALPTVALVEDRVVRTGAGGTTALMAKVRVFERRD